MNKKISKKKTLFNNFEEKTNSHNVNSTPMGYQNIKTAAAAESLKRDWVWGAFIGAECGCAFTILAYGGNLATLAFTLPIGTVLGGATTLAVLSVNYINQKKKSEQLSRSLEE